MMEKMTIDGTRIRNLRKSLEISQQAMADAIGNVSRCTLKCWELGTRRCRGKKAEALLKAFCDYKAYLLGETDELITLKLCPFCGMNAAVFSTALDCETCANFEDEECYSPSGSDCHIHFVVCDVHRDGCGASTGWYSRKEAAAYAWNRRKRMSNTQKGGEYDEHNEEDEGRRI